MATGVGKVAIDEIGALVVYFWREQRWIGYIRRSRHKVMGWALVLKLHCDTRF
jgi:hypothetical protein